MRPQTHILSLIVLSVFVSTQSAVTLDEPLDFYTSPRAVAVGGAYSAVVSGAASLFHNPAGLARGPQRKFEFTPLAFDFISSLGATIGLLGGQMLSQDSLVQQAANTPDQYHFIRASLVPSYATHNFGIAFLGSFRFAAVSHDGVNVDVDLGNDYGVVLGGSTRLAGNLIKAGVALKAIARDQIKGVVDPGLLTSAEQVNAVAKAGFGIGADLGLLFTLPQTYLPTLSVVWSDVMGTRFARSSFVNSTAQQAPDTVAQSYRVGFSLEPRLSRNLRTLISLEYGNIERSDWPWRKKVHVGLQIETYRSFYIWAGLNQLYLTAGLALRVPGGDLEIGSYAQDIGEGPALESNRRFFVRYTIGL